MKRLPVVFLMFAMAAVIPAPPAIAEQPTVEVRPPDLHGPRPLEDQTATAAVRDYLESWQSLRSALLRNRTALLDPDFVGAARDRLANTVHQQAKLGIHTRYVDRAHDLQIVFYSPEGLSIELVDNVVYDQQVLSRNKVLAKQLVHARYVVVLTPAELRWRVRIFQASPKR